MVEENEELADGPQEEEGYHAEELARRPPRRTAAGRNRTFTTPVLYHLFLIFSFLISVGRN